MDNVGLWGKHMRVKYILSVTFCALIVCTGCMKSEQKEDIAPDRQAKIYADNIIECFEKEDNDSLYVLFSQSMRDEHDLNNEIEQAFGFIDGQIISYDTPEASSGGGIMRGTEGEVKSTFSGWITDVKTDIGGEYTIFFGGYLKDDDDENNIGLSAIRIRNVTLYEDNRDNPYASKEIGHKNY